MSDPHISAIREYVNSGRESRPARSVPLGHLAALEAEHELLNEIADAAKKARDTGYSSILWCGDLNSKLRRLSALREAADD